jgi:GABA(A) receptor-associated protein
MQTAGAAIRSRFPTRVPIVLAADEDGNQSEKFLAPEDMSIREFSSVIRTRMLLPAEKALFIFIDTANEHVLPPSHSLLRELYTQHKADDECLHMTFTGENTFG